MYIKEVPGERKGNGGKAIFEVQYDMNLEIESTLQVLSKKNKNKPTSSTIPM